MPYFRCDCLAKPRVLTTDSWNMIWKLQTNIFKNCELFVRAFRNCLLWLFILLIIMILKLYWNRKHVWNKLFLYFHTCNQGHLFKWKISDKLSIIFSESNEFILTPLLLARWKSILLHNLQNCVTQYWFLLILRTARSKTRDLLGWIPWITTCFLILFSLAISFRKL